MVDATSSQAFQRILLDVTADGRDLAGRVGKLVPTKSTRLAEMLNSGPPQSCRLLKVEQRNSSIIYDDKIYLKLFRKLEEGINLDLALTKQLSDKCGFEHVPAYLGDIQYVAPGQDPGSVVVIQACTPNEQDGWSHTLWAVSRYFDRVLAEPQLPQPPLVGLWQEAPEPLARRTVPMVNMRRILRRVRIRAQPSLALATEWSSRFPSRFAGWATTLVLSPGFWGRRHKSRFKCSS